MQVELRQLQQRLGITTIVVTHDQREAMTMADLVVVMNEGRIRQGAPPVEIYRRPADTFVADFIGITNLLRARRGPDGAVRVAGGSLAGVTLPAEEAMISVRPEDVRLVPPEAAAITGRVEFVRDLGASIEIYVEAEGQRIVAVASPRERPDLQPGATVGLALPADACVVLGA